MKWIHFRRQCCLKPVPSRRLPEWPDIDDRGAAGLSASAQKLEFKAADILFNFIVRIFVYKRSWGVFFGSQSESRRVGSQRIENGVWKTSLSVSLLVYCLGRVYSSGVRCRFLLS